MSVLKLMPWPLLDASKQQESFELIQYTLDALTAHIHRASASLGFILLKRFFALLDSYVLLTETQQQYIADIKANLDRPICSNLDNLFSDEEVCSKETLLRKIETLQQLIEKYQKRLSALGE
jgi:DNA-binding MarR family transcriptional regulator